MSRIGVRPVALPASVEASVEGQTVKVTGPRGSRSFTATEDVSIAHDAGQITVAPRGGSKRARQQWGMSRTMIANLVTGVTDGFRKQLEVSGVGYRAQMQGTTLKLNLGLSHEVNYQVPDGVTVSAPRPTEVHVEGIDQARVGQVAAEIRAWRPPEPYKGKGIRYKNEVIFRKEGKKK